MIFKLLTPEGTRNNGEVTSVTVKTTEGYMTILNNHSPLIASIVVSKLSWDGENGKKEGAISGGILTVSPDEVNIISDSFEFSDQIDLRRAQKEKADAEAMLAKINKTDSASEWRRAKLSLMKATNRMTIGK